MVTKYPLPVFLNNRCTRTQYKKWLQAKATAHVRRDKKGGNESAAISEYKEAIHSAVTASGGFDVYTCLPLKWELISRYDNAEAKSGGRAYKRRFRELPTVDHVGDGLGRPDFKICSWRVNDAKSDLTLPEFLVLCRQVLRHNS